MNFSCSACNGCAVAREKFRVDVRGDYVVGLLGNPNTGKSTLFNALTGLRQHTGNWPGKTVGHMQGYYRTEGGTTVTLVDLPGTYSLNANSKDEEVTAEFLMEGGCDVAVTVVDATALERNLFLVLQVMEFQPRQVVALNLMDEAMKRGIRIDVSALSEELGIPVAPVVARSGNGVPELVRFVDDLARGRMLPAPRPVRLEGKLGEAVGQIESIVREVDPLMPSPHWVAKRLLIRGAW